MDRFPFTTKILPNPMVVIDDKKQKNLLWKFVEHQNLETDESIFNFLFNNFPDKNQNI